MWGWGNLESLEINESEMFERKKNLQWLLQLRHFKEKIKIALIKELYDPNTCPFSFVKVILDSFCAS